MSEVIFSMSIELLALIFPFALYHKWICLLKLSQLLYSTIITSNSYYSGRKDRLVWRTCLWCSDLASVLSRHCVQGSREQGLLKDSCPFFIWNGEVSTFPCPFPGTEDFVLFFPVLFLFSQFHKAYSAPSVDNIQFSFTRRPRFCLRKEKYERQLSSFSRFSYSAPVACTIKEDFEGFPLLLLKSALSDSWRKSQ